MLASDLRFTDLGGKPITDIAVTPGESVVFRVHNDAGIGHNFYVGYEHELWQVFGTTDVGIETWTTGVRELDWVVPHDPRGLLFASTDLGPIMHGIFSLAGEPAGGEGAALFPGVYDYGEALSRGTEAAASATIEAIRERTGVDVAVYTQLVAEVESAEKIDDSARILTRMGTGPNGVFEDIAVLLDMTASGCGGRAEVYARPPYATRILTDHDRSVLFESTMLPHL